MRNLENSYCTAFAIYNIRCSVYLGENLIKILINIEAQKSTNPSKLGYHLDNRIIFYLGRMISAQKEVEFQNSRYDDLKAVRSIWICMDSADDEDSINRIRFKQENVYGKQIQLDNIDKVQGVIIRIRANENADTSKNRLIAMLEELLKKDSPEQKKRKLQDEYDIVMDVETERRVNTMCNISEFFIERYLEQGIEKGRNLEVYSSVQEGDYGLQRGAEKLGISIEELEKNMIEAGFKIPETIEIGK